jgi:hypothetical protein
MANASPVAHLVHHCAYGLLAGLFFGALLLVFNIGDLWTLTRYSPVNMGAVVLFGALAFEPVVICASVGGWRRGEQGTWRNEVDEF